MTGSLYLAWRYSCHHRGTTAVLIIAISSIAYLPLALDVIVENAEQHFRGRSRSTPLVVGPRGSQLELVLASLYFDEPHDLVFRMDQLERIDSQSLGRSIPLHLRFVTRECRLLERPHTIWHCEDYRSPRETCGTFPASASSAHAPPHGLTSGSAPECLSRHLPRFCSIILLCDCEWRGFWPPTETPDDEAIFVHLKTAWILEGLGHGHAVGAKHGSPEASLYTDITPKNVDTFHFHGDESTFPVSAIIVVPESKKAETLLLGITSRPMTSPR